MNEIICQYLRFAKDLMIPDICHELESLISVAASRKKNHALSIDNEALSKMNF